MTTIDAGPAWSAWTQVTPVLVARAASAPYVRVQIPLSIAAGENGDFPSLRVIDADGRERPYALDPELQRADDRAVSLIDVGFVPRRGTQGVIDLGTSGTLVDAITLEVDTTREATFFEPVAIDASDDRRTWRIVRSDAIIYRVAQDAGRGNTTLTFPPTRSRWLRIRVPNPDTAFPLSGARAGSTTPPQPSLVRVPVQPTERDDAANHEQSWTFALPVPTRAKAVAFTDGGTFYERSVTIDLSQDARTWETLSSGRISHYPEGGSQTTLSLAEVTTRYVRVTVRNENDAPVSALRPTLLARPHAIVFPAGGSERLISGNPNAGAPTYDLAARLSHEDWHAADATLGSTAANAGYHDSRPVGERYPWLLTAALVVVAAALGFLALQTLRPARSP
jgi:hypothetical protein